LGGGIARPVGIMARLFARFWRGLTHLPNLKFGIAALPPCGMCSTRLEVASIEQGALAVVCSGRLRLRAVGSRGLQGAAAALR